MPFYCVVYDCASKEKIGDDEQESKTLFFLREEKANTQISTQSNRLWKYGILDLRLTARD